MMAECLIALLFLAICFLALYWAKKEELKRQELYFERLERVITNALINSRINK